MRLAAPDLVAPAWSWVPPHADGSAGGEAADLAASIGVDLDPEQRLALDVMLAERRDGRWAALEACIVCPRQNMKTLILEISVLNDLFVRDAGLVIWTAHRFRTTEETFRDLRLFVDSWDHLRRRVKRITTGVGSESIELLSGSRISFLARSNASGRGLGGDVVVLDEGLYLTDQQLGALLPTLSARPNPHVRHGSSAGVVTSDALRAIRDRGRGGGDPSLCYVEWAAPEGRCADQLCDHQPGRDGCALDDPGMWRAANPAIGRRRSNGSGISEEFVAAERRAMSPAEFSRERLGWWEDPPDPEGRLIPADDWVPLHEPGSQAQDPLVFSVDVALDRSVATVGMAGASGDAVHVEVVEHRPGVAWVPAFVAGLVERWSPRGVVLAAGSPAGSLIPGLRAVGVEPVLLTARDVTRACARFYDRIQDRTLRHLDQAPLNSAVAGARRRDVDAWVWIRADPGVDLSPLYAATLAAWGHESLEPPEEPGDPSVWVL